MPARVALVIAAVVACAAFAVAPARAQTPVPIVNGPQIFEPNFASDPAGAVAAARQKIAAGDLNGAIKGLEIYVISHPLEVYPQRFLGDLYYRAGRFDRAEYVYLTLLVQNPRDKETHNRLGVVYATENRVDDAIGQFNAALPGTDSVADLVAMHARKGDLPAYEGQMTKLAASLPNDPDIQAEMGQVLAALHKPSEASMYFMRALDSDNENLTAINGLGLADLDLMDYTNAELNFKRCLGLDPTNYSCNDNLAATYLESKRYAEAGPVLDLTYKISPERPEALVNYGFLADVRGDWKTAVQWYVKAIAVGPYQPEAYVNLGIDYEGHALYPLAQSALIKGVAAAPQDGRIRFLLGRAYAEQGQTSLAMKEYAAAERSFDPNIAHIAQEESAKLTPAETPAVVPTGRE